MSLSHPASVVALVIALVIVSVLVVGALLVGIRLGRRRADSGSTSASTVRRDRPPRSHFQDRQTPTPVRRLAVVVNPTKLREAGAAREHMSLEATRLGWDQPLWLETTAEDSGIGQAREALRQDVDLVCVLGGDGTVRNVAGVLAGTPTPLGLLPAGTGNLLARNLGLPLDDRDAAIAIALTGQNRRVDVGRLYIDASGEHERPDEQVFLVMAGLGWDAAMISGAPDRLKKRVGYLAYAVSGVRNLRGTRFRARVAVDDKEPLVRSARTVVIGNCGRLMGGVVLMPQAEVDDGMLDAIVLSPRGIAGWLAMARSLIRRHRAGAQIDHVRGARIVVRSERPEEVQVDGDVVGSARTITAQVEPGSLVVRVG